MQFFLFITFPEVTGRERSLIEDTILLTIIHGNLFDTNLSRKNFFV